MNWVVYIGRLNDLTGQKFGKWTVLYQAESYVDKRGHTHRKWHCICECSKRTEKDVLEATLKNGTSTSCGCKRGESNRKHGLSNTRIKKIYYNMRSRCYNENTPKYKNHGGRGIGMCDEWLGKNGLINFYNWSMSNGYSEELTLDRIDNDGNYEPNNCRWTNYGEQNRNKRDNVYITINGVTKIMQDWANEYGISESTIHSRIEKGLYGEDLIKPISMYPGCSSGFPGVFYRKDANKWRASITKDNIKYDLGTYTNLFDAVKARLNGELEHYGKYLCDINEVNEKLNKIQG